MTGSVSKGENNHSQSLQMTQRPLMTADELKAMKKGSFIVMKTGTHPFISKLKLFTKWGIAFGRGVYNIPEKADRPVFYAGKETILGALNKVFPAPPMPVSKHSGTGGTVMGEYDDIVGAQVSQQVRTE